MRRPWDRDRAAFTLIEVLVVMVVIGILAGLILGISRFSSTASREAKARAEIERLHDTLEDYMMRNGAYPLALTNALPAGLTFDNEGYAMDPWDRRYSYVRDPKGYSYVLFSRGPSESTPDDDIYSGR